MFKSCAQNLNTENIYAVKQPTLYVFLLIYFYKLIVKVGCFCKPVF